MNKTIKYLLEKELARQIVVTYDNHPTIDKSRIDAKNGYIRFWDCKRVVDKLPLKDLGITENEAKELINHVALDTSLSFSSHPITENFKLNN